MHFIFVREVLLVSALYKNKQTHNQHSEGSKIWLFFKIFVCLFNVDHF